MEKVEENRERTRWREKAGKRERKGGKES